MLCNLNFGMWKSMKLHTFKLININVEDEIIHLKLKIMDIFCIDEINKIELIYCGQVMVNTAKISNYMSDDSCIIFVISTKNESRKKARESHSEEELNFMLAEYNNACRIPDFKEIFLNSIKPETIMSLVANIPELSTDSIALSIIKDPFLLKTLLDPSAIKIQIEKHPALLLATHYLVKNVLQKTLNKNHSYSSIHLTDEDFSDSDDIDISYSEQFPDRPVFSSYNPITVLQLESALQSVNRNNQARNENEAVLPIPLMRDSFLEGALRDVLVDPNNHDDGTDTINDSNSTSLTHQVHQMHEVGLLNDLLNFRALEVAGGDVQGAIELILNGIIN